MVYPVTTLISEAFYTSGIVSRQFQTVAGDQFETGFLKLNEILADTAIEEDMIPYFNTAYDFFASEGVERYFIPNLAEAETITFFINSVRYSTRKAQQDSYFGAARADNITSLPYNWHVERCFGGSNLFLYFFPDKAYPMQITGRFRLQNVSVNQDLQARTAIASLGAIRIIGTGVLSVGQLVINGVDLAGMYLSSAALANYINDGAVPNVSATISGTSFTLTTNNTNSSIIAATSGDVGTVTGVTFSNFSTQDGPLNQTFISVALDQYYINYLQYRLAEKICTAYNFIMPDGAAKELKKYTQLISKRSSPIDFSMNKISTLNGSKSINYAQVNLGRGWTV